MQVIGFDLTSRFELVVEHFQGSESLTFLFLVDVDYNPITIILTKRLDGIFNSLLLTMCVGQVTINFHIVPLQTRFTSFYICAHFLKNKQSTYIY